MASFLMAHQRIRHHEAVARIKQVRDIAPNSGFLKQLAEFEQELGIQ
jgi:hypothetical protein